MRVASFSLSYFSWGCDHFSYGTLSGQRLRFSNLRAAGEHQIEVTHGLETADIEPCRTKPTETNRHEPTQMRRSTKRTKRQVQTEREKATYAKESAEENRVFRCVFVKINKSDGVTT